MTMVNEAHLNEWVADLRTTEAGQVRATLASPDLKAFCCLGRGCVVAGIAPEQVDGVIEFEGQGGLPPVSFLEWLGLDVDERVVTGHPVLVGWPRREWFLTPPDEYDEEQPYWIDDETSAYAQLNDDLGLTFAQIADVLAYFGVA